MSNLSPIDSNSFSSEINISQLPDGSVADFSAPLLENDDNEDDDLIEDNICYAGYVNDRDTDLSWKTLIFHSLKKYSRIILQVILPMVWCVFFISIMDRTSLMGLLYMPVLGMGAAFLANSVPIGGGIVYIPVLHLLGVDVKLGAAFTVATMTIGNGVLGFLSWYEKDDSLIIWESFPFTVIPSSIATLIALYLVPHPDVKVIKQLFGGFCAMLGLLVAYASFSGGISKALLQLTQQISDKTLLFQSKNRSTNQVFLSSSSSSSSQISQRVVLSIVSFTAGLILVPNIGVGPALTTYFVLELFGYTAEQAIVTGIITGGWVCIAPFIVHAVDIGDIPWKMWVMVLPGIFFGAKYAPLVHSVIGIRYVLAALAFFLILTSFMFLNG